MSGVNGIGSVFLCLLYYDIRIGTRYILYKFLWLHTESGRKPGRGSGSHADSYPAEREEDEDPDGGGHHLHHITRGHYNSAAARK
jgi:hypothetical protein